MSSSSECPLCFEHFPVSVLERHASGCSGKKETRATVKNNDSQIRAKPVEAKKRSLPVESDCVEENHGGSPNVGAKKRGRIEEANGGVPLAEQMRPIDLSSFVGQPEVTGDGSVFRNLLFRDEIPSVVLWGPPGCGKTSLANVIAHRCRAGNRYRFVKLSACTAGVADVKDVVRAAKNELKLTRRRTVLFVDEVHRFNKLQQDVFLPHVEDGTLILVGATTENPSFSLNSALLSRCRVIVLEKLSPENIMEILRRAAEAKNLVVVSNNEDVETSSTRGDKWISEEALDYLAHVADGDARTALNCLQMAMGAGNEGAIISVESIKHSLKRAHLLYDRKGDQHFDCISALHKSIRGSDDNAAIYWCTRMLAGGEDPLYVARRLVRIAGEGERTLEKMLLRQRPQVLFLYSQIQ